MTVINLLKVPSENTSSRTSYNFTVQCDGCDKADNVYTLIYTDIVLCLFLVIALVVAVVSMSAVSLKCNCCPMPKMDQHDNTALVQTADLSLTPVTSLLHPA